MGVPGEHHLRNATRSPSGRRLRSGLDHQRAVAEEVADGRIDLRQRDPDLRHDLKSSTARVGRSGEPRQRMTGPPRGEPRDMPQKWAARAASVAPGSCPTRHTPLRRGTAIRQDGVMDKQTEARAAHHRGARHPFRPSVVHRRAGES